MEKLRHEGCLVGRSRTTFYLTPEPGFLTTILTLPANVTIQSVRANGNTVGLNENVGISK